MSKQKDSKQKEVKHHEKMNKAVEIKDTKNSPELDKKKKTKNIKSTEENKFVEKENFTKIKYESFENKLIKQIILMVFTLILSLGMIYYALNNTNKESISYTQNGNVDYKVCLKENNFYSQNCLDKNMSYVSSLIKNVGLTFNYDLNTSEQLNVKTEYEVTAKLVISNAENTSKYFEQKYILQDKTSEGISQINNEYKISKNIDIDYDYYNTIASTFKSQYGVETNSYIEVSFQVFHTNKEIEDIRVPSPSPVILNIPLS